MATTPRGYERFDLLSDSQKGIYDTIVQRLMAQMGGEGSDAFAAPYMRQFQERTIPQLAEQFAGLGAGAQSSSAFQQQLGSAGAGLSENLASLGAQREQGIMQMLLQILSQPQFGLVKKGLGLGGMLGKAGAGALGGAATGAVAGSVVPGLGTATGAILGGLAGAAKGFQ